MADASSTPAGGLTGGRSSNGADAIIAAVEKTRSWTGLIAVVVGDVAIAIAATLGVIAVKDGSAGSASVVSILTSAFTAVGTLTTAYFGIKAVANTAQSSISGQSTGQGTGAGSDPSPTTGPAASSTTGPPASPAADPSASQTTGPAASPAADPVASPSPRIGEP
jgi:hypothetical protein